ncbi:NADH-quinone oxidoreductase subunit J family protein [Desulfofustis limnaeus]|jgi:NADH-quinone oxidoreductase subunit J|uniref:NADH-quinone oxidoreductase subunit J n=1 Tax=Desulfofustis limnaeus TaxID=2740163 RepID=A0ABM7WEE1_9BACT|nr:NADH-quinone oxidoreductase subunit J [Desulfofustis limnaeus]MDX9895572.1 NADH-quinone oxidoreductase subunit J [Desulfofustis sp.]BDD89349.1 NADH dehydrogenase subunit J [Desulfofustis limnaeus]
MIATYLFFGLALLAVLGSLGLILFRHPMNGAMSFVVTLIALAGLYALLSAKLIFAIQLIVYAGAIMSLILFIIMFLNIQEKDLPVDTGRWFYLAGGIVVLAPVAGLLLKIVQTLPEQQAAVPAAGFGEVREVGKVLFQQWLLPFEIVSILLLVALVGAVVLAGKRG